MIKIITCASLNQSIDYKRVYNFCALLMILNVINPLTADAQSKKYSLKDFNSLSWLSGTWQRINFSRPNRSGFESWNRQRDEWIGQGVSLQGNDTTFTEKLKIIRVDSEIHYVADVPENRNQVHFKFTSLTKNSFVCENPAHDYPKKIQYELKGDTLHAATSGNGKEQKFVFVRKR